MFLKKISWSLIAIFVFFSCLASTGCGQKEKKITLRILAASSLTEVFTSLEKDFEKENPKIDLQFNFAGTSTLVTQIKEGIEADVFVSANQSSIEELIAADEISPGIPKIFAHNNLVLMVYKDTPYDIKDLTDVLQEGVKIVLAEPAQPIGKYTEEMLNQIEIKGLYEKNYKESFYDHVVSFENSVKGVTTKVSMGEADVGIVYASDVLGAEHEKVISIEIPDTCNQIATYEVAILTESKKSEMAQTFVDYMLEVKGQMYLLKYGFMLPK